MLHSYNNCSQLEAQFSYNMSIRDEYTKYGQLKAKILKGESKPLSSRLVQEGSKTYFSVIWTKTFRKREGLRHSFFTFRMDGQIATAVTQRGNRIVSEGYRLIALVHFSRPAALVSAGLHQHEVLAF